MYALVDCNNFYCSCERVFNPKLECKPVIVLSNNDGCAIARSEEAKAVGIEMGSPFFMIEDVIKKHGVHVFSSNYTLYQDMSDRVMSILKEMVPGIEVYSIDEAFLDLHDLPYCDLEALAKQIRQRVKQYTGIPVSVGVAPTKTLAKMANRYAKKRLKAVGVFYAKDAAACKQMLEATAVGDIWGVGRQYAKFLNAHGFETAADVAKAPEEWMRKNMTVVGQRLWNELNGKPCIEWEFVRAKKKNIGSAKSFGHLSTDKQEIEKALADYTANCARKLRMDKSCAKEIYVFIHTNPHKAERDPQYSAGISMKLPTATSNTGVLVFHALKALNVIYRPGFRYLKCGINLIDLVPEDQIQQNLFEPAVNAKSNILMKALDSINQMIGKDIVRVATQSVLRTYQMRQEYLSKRYTTRLSEIAVVKR